LLPLWASQGRRLPGGLELLVLGLSLIVLPLVLEDLFGLSVHDGCLLLPFRFYLGLSPLDLIEVLPIFKSFLILQEGVQITPLIFY
jgi:hypothetical protein